MKIQHVHKCQNFISLYTATARDIVMQDLFLPAEHSLSERRNVGNMDAVQILKLKTFAMQLKEPYIDL